MKTFFKIICILAALAGLCLLLTYLLSRHYDKSKGKKNALWENIKGRFTGKQDEDEIKDYRDEDDDALEDAFDDAEAFFAGIDGSKEEEEDESGLSEDALEQLLDADK